jgi:hypothetical protein
VLSCITCDELHHVWNVNHTFDGWYWCPKGCSASHNLTARLHSETEEKGDINKNSTFLYVRQRKNLSAVKEEKGDFNKKGTCLNVRQRKNLR